VDRVVIIRVGRMVPVFDESLFSNKRPSYSTRLFYFFDVAKISTGLTRKAGGGDWACGKVVEGSFM